MSGSVDNYVLASWSAELDLRGSDCNILFLLLEKGVEEKCILELHSFRGTSLSDALDLSGWQ